MRKITKIKKGMRFIFVIFLFPLQSFSQDISGVWTGYMYNDTTHRNIHYELAINESNGKASGYSHTTFVFDSVKNIGVKSVKIKIKKDHIYIMDDDFIFNNYSIAPPKDVKMYSELTLSENDSAEVLSGNWMTNSTRIYNSVTGTVFLQKKKNPEVQEQTAIVTKLTELGLRDKLAFLPPDISLNNTNTLAINESPKTSKQQISAPSNNSSKPSNGIVLKNEESQKVVDKKNENLVVENKKAPTQVQSVPAKTSPVISSEQKNDDVAIAENKKPLIGKITPSLAEKKTIAEVSSNQNITKSNVVIEQKKNQPAQVIAATKKTEPSNSANQKNKAIVIAEQKSSKPEIKNIPSQSEKKGTLVDITAAKPTGRAETKKETESAKKEAPVMAVHEQDQQQIQNKNQESDQNIKSKNENKFVAQAPPPAAEIAKREIETIRTVEITQDSVVFSLYDNGTVDGDTVSVLLNGKVIMPRVGLLASAINKTIYLTPEMGDSISVIMYAENLGSLPPNTGLLVIREATRIYEIRFSGDLNKNSKIILLRKKKE
jgi:hypothetical protein